jgi:hypothetical protein|nr:MAG TPA: hypothetical protein [Caudoviricetes sp.]
MRNTLPGIKTVDYCFADELILKDAGLLQEGDIVSPLVTFYPYCLVGLGKCEVQYKIEGGQDLYETKVTFFVSDKPERFNRFLCFRLTTVQGSQYLIGTDNRPFPLMTWKEINPSSASERKGYEVTITYKNIVSTLRIHN